MKSTDYAAEPYLLLNEWLDGPYRRMGKTVHRDGARILEVYKVEVSGETREYWFDVSKKFNR